MVKPEKINGTKTEKENGYNCNTCKKWHELEAYAMRCCKPKESIKSSKVKVERFRCSKCKQVYDYEFEAKNCCQPTHLYTPIYKVDNSRLNLKLGLLATGTVAIVGGGVLVSSNDITRGLIALFVGALCILIGFCIDIDERIQMKVREE